MNKPCGHLMIKILFISAAIASMSACAYNKPVRQVDTSLEMSSCGGTQTYKVTVSCSF